MKKLNIVLAFLISISVSGVNANDHQPSFFPMEGVQCKFNAGKGFADLETVVAKWNKYMDQSVAEGNPDYTAYLLTPYMVNESEIDLDFVWLGMWSNFSDLRGITQYFSEASEIERDFNDLSTCKTRQLAPTLQVRDLKVSAHNAEGNIVQLRSCTNVGTVQETLAAYQEFNQRMDKIGSDMGIWLLAKGPGSASNADYDFMQMSVSTAEVYGNTLEAAWNGQAFQGMQMADKIDCGPSRVYLGRGLRTND
ncbi:MAG: hypothetical protein EVA48_03890 [Gammaproteobacteria bacterium]|nr:MAG: hypothetical protein EVA48_03890 [Gammaproteobacteria bacterium]